jgi:broad specificity phosphatase PhoE
MATPETPSTTMKTIYLIRHAESEENRRLGSLGKCFSDLGRFKLPAVKDVTASLGLINVPAQLDSDVSEKGALQISTMGEELKRDKFLAAHGIELVVHSPLKRARQTSLGMLGCMTPNDKDEQVGRVEELPLIEEKTPAEWLPGNIGSLHQRIEALEDWLRAQPESKIALVGHSQFFKAMLGLKFKFGNCDVWQIQLDAPEKDDTPGPYGILPREWSGLQRLHTVVLPTAEPCDHQPPS